MSKEDAIRTLWQEVNRIVRYLNDRMETDQIIWHGQRLVFPIELVVEDDRERDYLVIIQLQGYVILNRKLLLEWFWNEGKVDLDSLRAWFRHEFSIYKYVIDWPQLA